MRGPTIGVLAVLVIMTAGCGQIPSGAAPVRAASGTGGAGTRPPTAVRPTPQRAPDHARARPGHADRLADLGPPDTPQSDRPAARPRSRTGCP